MELSATIPALLTRQTVLFRIGNDLAEKGSRNLERGDVG